MQPKSEEPFEQYLRKVEPLPPAPLPGTISHADWSPRALAAIAAVIVGAVGLVLWQSRSAAQLIRHELAGESAVVRPAAMNKAAGGPISDLELPDLNGTAVRLSALHG